MITGTQVRSSGLRLVDDHLVGARRVRGPPGDDVGSVDLGPEIRVGREGDLVERTEVGRSIAVDRKRSNTVVRHDRGDTRQPVDRGIRAQERRRSVVFVGIDGDIGNVLEALDAPERRLGPPRAGDRDQDHASGNPDEERDPRRC